METALSNICECYSFYVLAEHQWNTPLKMTIIIFYDLGELLLRLRSFCCQPFFDNRPQQSKNPHNNNKETFNICFLVSNIYE